MNACRMVHECLVHQCPDLFGLGDAPAEGSVPPALRYGGLSDITEATPSIAEEPCGDPEARQW